MQLYAIQKIMCLLIAQGEQRDKRTLLQPPTEPAKTVAQDFKHAIL